MWQLAGALEGPTFCLLDVDLAQKGPTSPSEGPDVSLLAHNFDILAFNVTNNVILLSQPCRLFWWPIFVIKGHLDDIKRGRCLSFLHNTTHSLVRESFLVFCLGIYSWSWGATLVEDHSWHVYGVFYHCKVLQLGFDKLFMICKCISHAKLLEWMVVG